MSIVSLGRHQLPQPPHRELRRKSVFASRGVQGAESSRQRSSVEHAQTVIRYDDVRHTRR